MEFRFNSKEFSISVFYTLINPAIWIGFLFITGSVKAEWIVKQTGFDIFSLYGFLSTDRAFEFSSQFQRLSK